MRSIARRLALAILTVWLVSVAVFLLMRAGPGDPVSAALGRGEGAIDQAQVERLRAELGLDRPLLRQYMDWFTGLLRFEPGRSLVSGRSVTAEIGPRLALTLELALGAALIAALSGSAMGLAASWSSGGRLDRIVAGVSLTLLSLPAFWIGLLLVIIVAARFGVLLGSGYTDPWDRPAANLLALAPAAFVLAMRPAALVARVVRAGTRDVGEEGFVVAARARGVSRWRGTWHHAFRVGALPAVPLMGVQIVYLLGGSVVIEQVFGLPGIGRAVLDAVSARDYPVIQFLVVVFAFAAVAVSMLADLVHAVLDPRVRR